MKIYIIRIILTVVTFFCSSCMKVSNAKCYFNEHGLLSVRKDGSVIAFILVSTKGDYAIKPAVLLNGKIINEEHVKKSVEIFNSIEAKNMNCNWAGITVGTWDSETIQYNCEEGITFWFTRGGLSGVRIIPGLFARSKNDIQINGKSVKLMNVSDYEKILGVPLNEKSYLSDY